MMRCFRNIFVFILLVFFSVQGNTPGIMRQLWKEAVERAPEYPEEVFEGRGIVIPAGREHYLVNAWINLKILRYFGCTLPVEIWYIGQKEVVPHLMEKLEGLGAKCCDITDYFNYPIKGWEVKVHAIIASRFQEVLLLDADNVVLSNPTYLFDCPDYLDTGALFWPDRNTLKKDNVLWKVLDLEPRHIRAQESGQIVVDKQKCWTAMNLCMHMNKESHFYYQHMYGDKDTFHLSFLATGTPFKMIEHMPGLVYRSPKKIFSSYLQKDCEGKTLFLHTAAMNWAERRNLQLHFLNYIMPTQPIDVVEPEYPYTGLPMHPFRKTFGMIEDRCIRYLKEVRPWLPNT